MSVDLYALSVCFYEMITGKQPFSGPSYLAQKQAGLFAPPTQLQDDLPEKIDPLFQKAFAVDPSKRFKSAAEFVAAVEAL